MSCCCGSTGPSAKAEPILGTTFKVEDMTCSHCVGVISRALQDGMPGVKYTVDLDKHEVVVAGDPAVAAALMRDAGYEPRLTSA